MIIEAIPREDGSVTCMFDGAPSSWRDELAIRQAVEKAQAYAQFRGHLSATSDVYAQEYATELKEAA
jgi:hypothetical protein